MTALATRNPQLATPPALSRRGLEMPASPIRRLVPLADAAKMSGTRVLHLNIGQPDIETPPSMLERLRKIDARVLEYSPSTGAPEFLGSLQRYYERRVGAAVEIDQILATTGASEAILFAFLACADPGDDLLVVDSLSKRYSACGIRLGSLITRNAAVYDACLRMAQARLSPPGLAQFISAGIENLGDDYTRAVVAEYQHRRDVLHAGLTSIPGVLLPKPEGAFYCIAQLPVDDADRFATWLLSDFRHDGATVMLAPANGFYASDLGRKEVRIAYVLREEDLRLAVEVLRVALATY